MATHYHRAGADAWVPALKGTIDGATLLHLGAEAFDFADLCRRAVEGKHHREMVLQEEMERRAWTTGSPDPFLSNFAGRALVPMRDVLARGADSRRV